MNLLRQTIRRLILEVYELSDEDVAKIQKEKSYMYGNDKFNKEWPAERIKKQWDDRGVGLQGTEPTKKDIDVMKQFHAMMQGNAGKSIAYEFMSGAIQVLHSISYQGLVSNKSEFQKGDKPFSTWLNKFGRRGKDMLSVVASPMSYDQSPDLENWYGDNQNAYDVYEDGYGFLMKGYPAFIAYEDVMSQTLSAVPDTLKTHQKSSGIAKRSGHISSALPFEEWFAGKGSDETLLDNWTVIGIFFGVAKGKPAKNKFRNPKFFEQDKKKYEQRLSDAKSTGLPIYQVQRDHSLKEIK